MHGLRAMVTGSIVAIDYSCLTLFVMGTQVCFAGTPLSIPSGSISVSTFGSSHCVGQVYKHQGWNRL